MLREKYPDISGYRILGRLAAGGTSDVLIARSLAPPEHLVCIKLVPKNDPSFEGMFAREALAYLRLRHPSVVRLLDFFERGEHLVLVLEFVQGFPLNGVRAVLRGEDLDDRAAVYVASRIFSALAHAHTSPDPDTLLTSPVIHGDVSPSNVLISWTGEVKLADFGIAKLTRSGEDTAVVNGTFGYMSPEQVRGEDLTPSSDVYAASLILWELLARRRPFPRRAASDPGVLRAIVHRSFDSLDELRPDLPSKIREVVARGLEPNPARRTVTAEEMVVVLRSIVPAEKGKAVLMQALSKVRRLVPPETLVEGERPQSLAGLSMPTPQAFATTDEPKPPPTEMPQRVPARWLIASAIVPLIVLVLAFWKATPLRPPTPAGSATSRISNPIAATAATANPPPPAPAPSVNPANVSVSIVDDTRGKIRTEKRASGHRIFVDGKVVGEGPGVYSVRCGAHRIRIGSKGKTSIVDVPCGSEISVK